MKSVRRLVLTGVTADPLIDLIGIDTATLPGFTSVPPPVGWDNLKGSQHCSNSFSYILLFLLPHYNIAPDEQDNIWRRIGAKVECAEA